MVAGSATGATVGVVSGGAVVGATVVAGYYSANGQLYRFAAAALALPAVREKAASLVLAGGLIGAIAGPNLAARSRGLFEVPFAGAYIVLAGVAVVAMGEAAATVAAVEVVAAAAGEPAAGMAASAGRPT